MARQYGVAVMPARAGKPRDKAKVENGVLNVERQIPVPLRHRTFFSVHELNQVLWELLERYNERPFRKLEGSRRSLFESVDRPALKPLPLEPYEYAEWKQACVNIDYHIDADPTLADAILDRLVHNTYKVDLHGESMRKKKKGLTDTHPKKRIITRIASLRSDACGFHARFNRNTHLSTSDRLRLVQILVGNDRHKK